MGVDIIKKQVLQRVEAENNHQASESSEAKEKNKLSDFEIIQCAHEQRAGDALVYIDQNLDKFLYVHNYLQWFKWVGHVWQLDKNDQDALASIETVAVEYCRVASHLKKQSIEATDKKVKEYIDSQLKILSRKINELRSNARENTLKFVHSGIDKRMRIDGDELDSNPYLLACQNGVIELKTGELRPGRPDDYLTCMAKTRLDALDKPAPIWEKFINDIFAGDQEIINYMHRFLGHCLIGKQIEHVFLILYGAKGRNGKDTLMNILGKVLGVDFIVSIPAEMLLAQAYSQSASQPQAEMIALRGRRITYASEADDNRRFSSSKVKLLSGGGLMVARGVQERHMSYWSSSHHLILLTNDLPKAKADDQAFWARVHVVNFKYSFLPKPNPNNEYEKKADPHLESSLEPEFPAILAWLVRGCLKYQRDGLNPPAQVLEATQSYRDSEDIVGRFIRECCLVQEGLETQASHLYDAFSFWYANEISRRGNYSPKRFGESLDKKDFEKKKKSAHFWQKIALSDNFLTLRAKEEEKENDKQSQKSIFY